MTTIVTLADPGSAEAEAFRALRTNLDSAAGAQARVILVTSPAPGAGRAETAANLAVVAAQTGRRVILVDADLRSPVQHELFGLPNDAGLSNLLAGTATLETVVRETEVETLRVVPAGPLPAQPADALSGPLAAVVFSQLRESADWVFVAGAPVLAGSEAGAAARLADGVLVVLAAGVSRRADATKAREVLDRVGARVLGSVLTGVSAADAGFAHYRRR